MKPEMSEEAGNRLLPLIQEIRELKRKHNAVVLSHYYMPAELQVTEADGGVADFVGDSLGLSVEAAKTEADFIVFCGVKFMAETAHILSPEKQVLLPSHEAGCSLAASITGADVRKLKEQHPGVPVVAYINTYAETKAECDICCTSRNALAIANSFDSDRLIFLPDKFMGRNLTHRVRQETGKELILWDGSCEVHELFESNLEGVAASYPEAEVLMHWEVPDGTVDRVLSNYKGMIGSTSDIIRYVGESQSKSFILGSECDLGAALKGQYPDRKFVSPCLVCQHMKQITLQNTLDSLRAIGTEAEQDFVVELDEELRKRASLPIMRMMEYS